MYQQNNSKEEETSQSDKYEGICQKREVIKDKILVSTSTVVDYQKLDDHGHQWHMTHILMYIYTVYIHTYIYIICSTQTFICICVCMYKQYVNIKEEKN